MNLGRYMATSEHPPNYLRAWFAGVQLKPSHSVAQTHLLNRWEFSLSSLKSMVPLAAFVCPFGCTEPTAGKHAEIFLRVEKSIGKEIPSQVVYEDQKVLAFRDISPQAPIHIIIIPKVKDGLSRLLKAEERHVEVLGNLLYAAKVVAKQEGLGDGFRIVINDGPEGCQSVYHLHVHLLGGRQMNWPPG
ncbi:hypothetical protein PAHAL_5G116600 [Panicum hallii]|uniref:HIT domain-containing protein n=1 Tax=Panicum hallii TaxID=206008 RepID=A0A2S3HQP8_9POAL|nr:hypothetical protein PAHAL_5G116600 [Panicum hallii]